MGGLCIISKYHYLEDMLSILQYIKQCKGCDISTVQVLPDKVEHYDLVISDGTIDSRVAKHRGVVFIELEQPIEASIVVEMVCKVYADIDGRSGGIVFSYHKRQLMVNEIVLDLTEIEAKILNILHTCNGVVGDDVVEAQLHIKHLDTHMLQTHMHRINKKLSTANIAERLYRDGDKLHFPLFQV